MGSIENIVLGGRKKPFRQAATGRVVTGAAIVLAGSAALLPCLGLVVAWLLVTQPVWHRPVDVSAPVVDPGRLEEHTRVLSEDLVPRDWSHPENLDRVADYIGDLFRAAGAAVTDQAYVMDGNSYRNVIGRLGPETGRRVVVGAHYDAFDDLPGADDNASGVAGLIELARLLGGVLLGTRVDLVAFTLEEPKTSDGEGLFRSESGGSAVYVRSLVEEHADVTAFVNLEMIGYFSDAEDSQAYPSPLLRCCYPSMGDFVAVVGRLGQGRTVRQVKAAMRNATGSLPVYSVSAHEIIEGIDWSDHANFWKAGYRAVMITDTSFLRNKAYHTPDDIADRLDYQRMAMVVQGVYAAVLSLGSGEGTRQNR